MEKVGNPLQTKQGNRPTGHDQEGRRGLNEVVPGTSVFPLSETDVLGDFWTTTRRGLETSPHARAEGLFHCGSEVKVSACNEGDLGSIPGSGRSPGEGNGNPLQCSCLENPRDGGAWWAPYWP